jgi:hypothetical protein
MDQPRSLMCWKPGADMPEDIEIDPLLLGLILRLPKMGGTWTHAERMSWITMFNAIVDGLHPESVTAIKDAPEPPKASRAEIPTLADHRPAPRAATQLLEEVKQEETTRNFVEQTPYAGARNAAKIVVEMIRHVGKPGHVWYNKATGCIRVCADDYKGEHHEVLVGVYDINVKPSAISSDIKEIREEIE